MRKNKICTELAGESTCLRLVRNSLGTGHRPVTHLEITLVIQKNWFTIKAVVSVCLVELVPKFLLFLIVIYYNHFLREIQVHLMIIATVKLNNREERPGNTNIEENSSIRNYIKFFSYLQLLLLY